MLIHWGPREEKESVAYITISGIYQSVVFFCFDLVKSLQSPQLCKQWSELVSPGVTGYI